MSFKISGKKFLDGETCYDLWARQRISIYKIPKVLSERGIINQENGKMVTPQGVWRSANLYALEHMEIAKSDTVSLFSQFGIILEEDEFYQEMLNKARQFYSKKKYRQFLAQNPNMRKYE